MPPPAIPQFLAGYHPQHASLPFVHRKRPSQLVGVNSKDRSDGWDYMAQIEIFSSPGGCFPDGAPDDALAVLVLFVCSEDLKE